MRLSVLDTHILFAKLLLTVSAANVTLSTINMIRIFQHISSHVFIIDK
jgi:hypothetical protein